MSQGRNEPCPCGSGRKYKRCCGKGDSGSVQDPGYGPGLSPDARAIAREAEVWEVDLVPMPARIGDQERKRTVAALVAADGLALATEILLVSGAEVKEVAAALEKALAAGARKVGVWPAVVHVRHDEVAEALEARLRERDCLVEASPFLESLDHLARDLAGHLSGRDAWPLASAVETWAAWGLPPYLVAGLFEAYAAYFEAEPWQYLDDVPPLAAEWEDGSAAWTASVMGAELGESGLAVYSSSSDFGDLLDLPEGGLPFQQLQGWVVHLSYDHRQDLPRPMVKEITTAGWKVVGVDAYPHILPIHTPGGGLQQDLVRRLTVLLNGVAAFVNQHGAKLRAPEGGVFEWSGNGLTLFTAIQPEGGFADAGAQPPPELQELVREIEALGLETQEEIQNHIAGKVGNYNQTPLDGLAGISPAQAQALIEEGMASDGILRMAEDLSLDELAGSEFLYNSRLFLAKLEEAGGTKATKAKNLTRAFVAEMLEDGRWPADYVRVIRSRNKVLNEEDFGLLHVLRVNLGIAGLIKLRKGTFSTTRKGQGLLSPGAAGRLQAHLFHSYFSRYNLNYGRRLRGCSELQPVVPLLLWQTSQRAGEWISVADLADLILPPSPAAEDEDESWRRRGEVWDLRSQILAPLEAFGLLEKKAKPEAAEDTFLGVDATLVRKTPLFDQFLWFEWE